LSEVFDAAAPQPATEYSLKHLQGPKGGDRPVFVSARTGGDTLRKFHPNAGSEWVYQGRDGIGRRLKLLGFLVGRKTEHELQHKKGTPGALKRLLGKE